MVAITNIKKITKAMKMVASAKLRRSEEALNQSRAFSEALNSFWPTQAAPDISVNPTAASTTDKRLLFVGVTPDRGLCGSVNGAVTRACRNRLNWYVRAGKELQIVGLGEKVRAGFERNYPQFLVLTVGEHSKLKRRTFKQTAELTDFLLKYEFDNAEFVFNRFKNLMSFETTALVLANSTTALADSKTFEPYELEGNSDLLENFYEFSLAVRLQSIFAETDMVEFSQRVNSMTSSSKNAEEMLSKVRLLYNRVRQARITTELVEIISGATAAAEQVQ